MALTFSPTRKDVTDQVAKLKEQDSWVLLTLDASSALQVASRGKDIKETHAFCNADNTAFIFVKVEDKYAYYLWNGEKLKPLQKSKILGTYKDAVKVFGEQSLGLKLSADGVVAHVDELTEESIRKKLFAGNTERPKGISVSPASSPVSSSAASSSTTVSPSSSSSASSSVKQSSNVRQMFSTALSMDQAGIEEVCKEIKQTKNRWARLAYDEQGVCKVAERGTDETVDVAKAKLSNNDIQYILIKLNVGDVLGYGSDTEKVLFIVYEAPGTSSLRRGKVNQHKETVYQFCMKQLQLAGQHVATSGEEVTDTIVKNVMVGNRGSGAATSQPATQNNKAFNFLSSVKAGLTRQVHSISQKAQIVQVISPPSSARKHYHNSRRLETGSACIKVINEEEAVEKLEDLSVDEGLLHYVIFGYDGKNVSELKLINWGSKSLVDSRKELTAELTDDALKYLVFKAYVAKGVDDARAKYGLVTFKGSKLKPVHLAISTPHGQKLRNTIGKIIRAITEITISSAVDISEAKLFSHEVVLPFEEAKKRLAVQKAKKTQPTTTFGVSTLVKEADLILAPEEAKAALKDLSNDVTQTNWILFCYETEKQLKYTKSGTNGLEDIKNEVNNDQILFIFFKTYVDETGYGGSPKVILIHFCGKNVRATKKAASAVQRASLVVFAKTVTAVAGEYEASGVDDLNEAQIKGKVTGIKGKASGSSTSAAVAPSSAGSRMFGGKNQNLVIKDEITVKQALKDVHSDANPTNWLLFKYEGESLQLVSKGKEGFSEFKSLLTPTDVAYVLYKILVEETGYGGSPKIVLITHVGKSVNGMQKAISSTHRLQLKNYAQTILSVAAEYQEEEATEEGIRAKITGSKGKMQVGQGQFISTAKIAVESTSHKGAKLHKQFGGRDSSLGFKNEVAVIEELKELRSNNSKIRWLVFGYEEDDPYKVKVVHKGPGGVTNFKPLMDDKNVYYILMRLSIIEYSGVAKAILITWVGENVENFHKSRSSGHRVDLYKYVQKHMSVGGEFAPQCLEDLTDDAVVAKITGGKAEQGKEEPNKEVKPNTRWEPNKQIQPKIKVETNTMFNKMIEFTGKAEVEAAAKELQDNKETMDFVKLEISGKTFRDVKVVEKGKGALTEEWRATHLVPTGINIFLVAVTTSEAGYGKVTKTVFIQWIGKGVKHLHSGMASELRWSLYKCCDDIIHFAGELQGCTLPEHVTQALVMEKISGSKVRGPEMELEETPTEFKEIGKKKVSFKYRNESEIVDALAEMLKEEPKHNWIGVKYVEGSVEELELDTCGAGGIEEFKQKCKPDGIYFIVHRIMHAFGYQRDFADIMSKPYYGLFQWHGNKVNKIAKALSSHHWNAFSNLIKRHLGKLQASIQGSAFFAEFENEITEEAIKKIMRLYD